jgi:hypothetical protein
MAFVYYWTSEIVPGLHAFTRTSSAEYLPEEHAPWIPGRPISLDQPWTRAVPLDEVEAGIESNGYFLWQEAPPIRS